MEDIEYDYGTYTYMMIFLLVVTLTQNTDHLKQMGFGFLEGRDVM